MHNTIYARVQIALTALKQGKMVVVMDDVSRENEGDIILAAQFATPQNINFMIKEARGLICAPITTARATALSLAPMQQDNQDLHQTAFTVSVDFESTHTGISAAERAHTLQALADLDMKATQFRRPGHIFPLVAKDGGLAERRGHTEAALDLMRLAQLEPTAVICEILNDDGSMARYDDLQIFCQQHQLPFLTIGDIVAYQTNPLEILASTALPTKYGQFTLLAFPNHLGSEPHLALIKTADNPDIIPLVRIHSECLTGDVFGSKKCDCQAQLHFGLSEIEAAQAGVLLYLRQEGRGIGLVEKIKAYALQDTGQDTIEANLSLGHPMDGRDFTIAADILKLLNIHTIKLITNNPQKQQTLVEQGIQVIELINTPRFQTAENHHYLMVKAQKMGHFL